MEKYKIYCTEEQTKKALELGAPIKNRPYVTQEKTIDFAYVNAGIIFNCPTAEQMIGFILGSGKGYSTDLSELIREQGYKQGCLTFIDNCLK